jgi:hypothetical protein
MSEVGQKAGSRKQEQRLEVEIKLNAYSSAVIFRMLTADL